MRGHLNVKTCLSYFLTINNVIFVIQEKNKLLIVNKSIWAMCLGSIRLQVGTICEPLRT